MYSRRIRAVLGTLLGLMLCAHGAHATVTSVSIAEVETLPGAVDGRYTWLRTSPLELSATTPISGEVEFRIYHAAGVQTGPTGFTLVKSDVRSMLGDTTGSPDLTQAGISIYIGDIVKTLPIGTHSFYITADDGEGASAPSNIVTVTRADNLLSKPVIYEATGVSTGTVNLKIRPLEFSGTGNPVIVFRVYRAHGRHLAPSKFDALTLPGTSIERQFIDTSGASLAYSNTGITISGLKSGMSTFFVTVAGPGIAESMPSNLVFVQVPGGNDRDGDIRIALGSVTSAVEEEIVAGRVAAYPNPASSLLHLSSPSIDGAVAIEIFDMQGVRVLTTEGMSSDGVCRVDVSTLPTGSYVAVTTRGSERVRSSFVVVR